MRRVTDEEGRRWDVVVGRESWGTLVALFVPVAGGGAVLSVPLAASSYDGAHQEVDALDESALISLLGRAQRVSLD